MTNQRKRLLLAAILGLVFSCYLLAQVNTFEYPQAVPYKPLSFDGDYHFSRLAALRGEVHTYFQTEDGSDLVATRLVTDGWQKKDFSLVDGVFQLYNGYYHPQRGTSINIGPFSYLTSSVIVLSFDEEAKMTIIEKITYVEMYYSVR